jgi:uncharacterized protein (DUF488 family)
MELFSVGHSNHSAAKFVDLLKKHNITLLVDVRSKPFSRFEWFRRDNLAKLVREHGIDYRWGGALLGGMNPVSVYADLFVMKMDSVLQLIADGHCVAIMCSEGKPCECHRAGKLTAWLHRERPHVKTTHILPDGSLVDGREYEPKILKKIWWREFNTKIPPAPVQAELPF